MCILGHCQNYPTHPRVRMWRHTAHDISTKNTQLIMPMNTTLGRGGEPTLDYALLSQRRYFRTPNLYSNLVLSTRSHSKVALERPVSMEDGCRGLSTSSPQQHISRERTALITARRWRCDRSVGSAAYFFPEEEHLFQCLSCPPHVFFTSSLFPHYFHPSLYGLDTNG